MTLVAADIFLDSSQTYHLRGSIVVANPIAQNTMILGPKYYTSLDDIYKDTGDNEDDLVMQADDTNYGGFVDDFDYNDDDFGYDDDDMLMQDDDDVVFRGHMNAPSWLASSRDFNLACALDHLSMMLNAIWLDIAILYQAASGKASPVAPPLFTLPSPRST
jgi:hypothetical protein